MHYTNILALLVFGHMLADYPLQGDFLARAKNRTAPIVGVPWWQALAAHSIIQAGFVGVITGSICLAVSEFCVHWITDDLKCRGKINFNTDQAIHIVSKLAWAGIAVAQ
jgi:type IV secretory pathway VirB3-like protein